MVFYLTRIPTFLEKSGNTCSEFSPSGQWLKLRSCCPLWTGNDCPVCHRPHHSLLSPMACPGIDYTAFLVPIEALQLYHTRRTTAIRRRPYAKHGSRGLSFNTVKQVSLPLTHRCKKPGFTIPEQLARDQTARTYAMQLAAVVRLTVRPGFNSTGCCKSGYIDAKYPYEL